VLQQLILNLIINARDTLLGAATPAIMIRLQRLDTDTAFLSSHADIQPAAYAQITVSDNGCGIETDKRDQTFEPFLLPKALTVPGLDYRWFLVL